MSSNVQGKEEGQKEVEGPIRIYCHCKSQCESQCHGQCEGFLSKYG